MFDRDPREEQEAVLAFVKPEDDAILQQAIDTVARRVVMIKAHDHTGVDVSGEDLPEISDSDWELIDDRVLSLVKELDRGQGPFEAAYELLKRRAERES